jgi:hypothetical protein
MAVIKAQTCCTKWQLTTKIWVVNESVYYFIFHFYQSANLVKMENKTVAMQNILVR